MNANIQLATVEVGFNGSNSISTSKGIYDASRCLNLFRIIIPLNMFGSVLMNICLEIFIACINYLC